MSSNNSNNKKTIFCVYGIIVLLLIAANVRAFSETETEAPKPTGMGVEAGRAIAAVKDRRAEEAYEKRNAEITPWAEGSIPHNPVNAALLYYQAFLLRPELNGAISFKIHDVVFSGVEPDRQVRTYLGYCLDVIEIVEIASRMPHCIWGIWPEHQLRHTAVRRELGRIAEILLVDARTLAADGHYRVALERCLTVQRITLHLNEDPEMFTLNTYNWSLETIRDLLGIMPPNVDILSWFRGQLGVAKEATPNFAEFFLQTHIESVLKDIRINPLYLVNLRNLLVEQASDEQAKKNARNLTDEQLLLRIDEGLKSLIDPIFTVLDSERTHKQKLNQMQQLINELTEADHADPLNKPVLINIANMEELINRGYKSHVWHLAHINCIKAAVEVYLVVAKTGRLPERLPEHLPKDPTTGRDFVYEITNEGFVLRCQDEDFLGHRSRKLEFKIKKEKLKEGY